MTISIELRTQILRLYQAEHWRVGTIARQLHLHRDTVTRVLSAASVVVRAHPRARQIDLYLPFVTCWPACAHGASPRPTCACAPCLASRPRSTGLTLAIGALAVPSDP